MDTRATTEWWTNQAENAFREVFLDEFFGEHFFEAFDQSHYYFTTEEKGDAVWIISSNEQDQIYKVLKVEGKDKFYPQPIIPMTVSFYDCASINLNWIDDGQLKRIQDELKRGAQAFARKANKAFIDVLINSVSEGNKAQLKDGQLRDLLAEVVDELRQRGFKADKFLFPATTTGRLIQQGIIIRDSEIQNAYYVGKTFIGQYAFSSDDLPGDIALIFDSSATISLQQKLRFRRENRLPPSTPFSPGVCGGINLNPIVKNTQAIIAMEGIQESFAPTLSPSRIQNTTVYIDLDRLENLRTLKSSSFDLTKLIRLCEELNISYANKCYLAVTMLTRAILDHVPPIFGQRTFVEVANNYGGASFKKSMQHLQNSSRNIADSYLHLPIRNTETLPNITQVNFSNDLDVLLAEIERILKPTIHP